MVNSREKGASGERELAKKFVEVFGCSARRGQQFSGSPESPDIVHSIEGLHVECKRVERLNLYDALAQSKRDSSEKEIPVVCHRKNREEWVLIVELKRVPELAKVIYENSNYSSVANDNSADYESVD